MRAAALSRPTCAWQPYAGAHADRLDALVAAIGERAIAWLLTTDSIDATWTAGPLGAALFFDALERAQPHEVTARAIVTGVRRALSAATLPLRGGLGGAPVGTAAALALLSRGGQRFAAPLAAVDRAAREHAQRRLSDCAQPQPSASAGMRDFDLITGAVGMLVYLDGRAAIAGLPPSVELARAWRRQLAASSARLAQAFADGARPLVHWGVAHGVAGLVAAAAPASDEAQMLLDVLEGALAADGFGPLLPFHSHARRFRSAWCHGIPGVVATLGRRLVGGARWSSWRAGLLAVAERPLEEQLLDGDDGLCHGLTGVLHCVACVAALTADPALAALRDRLLPRVLARVERRLADGGSFGFLDGLSGIGAVLQAARTAGWPAWHPLVCLPSDGGEE
jgi:hypothetical protein